MRNRWKLSAESITYAAAKCGKAEFIGIADVVSELKEKDYLPLLLRAENELLSQNAAQMDFDGNVELDPKFRDVICSCAACDHTICFSLGGGPDLRMLTVFSKLDRNWILEEEEQKIYRLFEINSFELGDWLTERLFLPPDNLNLNRITIDSCFLADPTKEKLKGYGCTEEMASLIHRVVVTKKGMVSPVLMRKGKAYAQYLWFIGEEGILNVGVDYSQQKEELIFEPINREKIRNLLLSNVMEG